MTHDVRSYYDAVTKRFVRTGGASQRTGHLHRALRDPSGKFGREATEVVYNLIRREIDNLGPPQNVGEPTAIADLGCGVGAGMEWFARRLNRPVVGITLSSVQAALARRRFGPRVAVTIGSFLDKTALSKMSAGHKVGAAYMVESFTHAENAASLFSRLSDVVEPNGALVICDDFPTLANTVGVRNKATAKGHHMRHHHTTEGLQREFRWGWHINSWITTDQVADAAQDAGWRLENRSDLSDLVLQNRPRDLVARVAAPVARRLGLSGPYWRNVRGGAALQRLIRRRRLRYVMLVFRRQP